MITIRPIGQDEGRSPRWIEPVKVPKGAQPNGITETDLPARKKNLLVPLLFFGTLIAALLPAPSPKRPSLSGSPSRRKGRRLYYMWTPPGGWPENATSIPKSKLKDYQRRAITTPGTLFYIWAESAAQARDILRTDPEARTQSYRQGDSSLSRFPAFSLSGFPVLGSPGAQATCALWQEKYSPFYGKLLWKCLKYAPACEPQIPDGEMCLTAPSPKQERQLRVCVDWKGVKSDPAGRYKGKTIKRCAGYSAVCTTKACIPEPMPKPEMEEPEISEKEVKALARGMAQEWNETQAAAGPALAREILSRGGIRSYRKGVEKEEYKEIPLHLKKKTGLPMDEMAAEMAMDEKELMARMRKAYPKGRKVDRRKKWQDFIPQARDIIMTEHREGLRLGRTQAELFRAKRELVLTPGDIATADDPLYICLQRMGWKLPRVQKLQASIAEKMTPDLFTGKKGRLTGGEKMLQQQIDECFKRIAAGRRTGKPEQMRLFGHYLPAPFEDTLSGEGCRDKEGKFIPVPQCTGRRPTAKKQVEKGLKELWQMTRADAEAEQGQLNQKAIDILKGKAEQFPEAYGRYVPKKGRTLSHDIAPQYLQKNDADRYRQLMYFAHKAAVEEAIAEGKKVPHAVRASVGLDG